MSGPGKDSTIAARVPHELRDELEAKRDEFRKVGIGYPDGRPADLSYVIRVGLRAYLDSRAELHPEADRRGLFAPTVEPPRGDGGDAIEALAAVDDLAVPSHADGPETERLAAAYAWPRAGSSRWKIIEHLLEVGHAGATSDELVRDLRMYSAQRRLHDLKRGGWVEVDQVVNEETDELVDRRRKTRQGAYADVYVLSSAAKARIAAEAIADYKGIERP